MNTDLDDPLARAVAAGRDRLLAMMQQPPQARPQPLTRKAYLAKLEPLVAEARGRGYSDTEIARALSLDAETLKALNLDLDALPVTERALRSSCGETAKVVESASLKARKQPAASSGGRGKQAAAPVAAGTKSGPAASAPVGAPADPAPSSEQASGRSASDRDADAARPAERIPERPERASRVAAEVSVQGSPGHAELAAPQAPDLFLSDSPSPASRNRAQVAGLAAFAKGHAQRIGSEPAASGTAPEPAGEPPF